MRFCWLWVVGQERRIESEYRLNTEQISQTVVMPPVLPIILALQNFSGADGLAAGLRPLALRWFAELQSRVLHIPADEARGEREWLAWACARKAGPSAFERIFTSALQKMAGWRQNAEDCANDAARIEAARLQREYRQRYAGFDRNGKERNLPALKRRSGQRALVGELLAILAIEVRRLVPDPAAEMARRRQQRAEYSSAAPEPEQAQAQADTVYSQGPPSASPLRNRVQNE